MDKQDKKNLDIVIKELNKEILDIEALINNLYYALRDKKEARNRLKLVVDNIKEEN